MSGLALLAVVAVIAAVVMAVAWPKVKTASRALSYTQLKPLTEREQTLYWRLVQALPECVVLSQVTFSRFMKPDTGGLAPLKEYRALQNRISQKTIDFLVCLPDFTVVAALELDDASHDQALDRQRDALLRAAGIAVLRIKANEMPAVARLRELFTTDPR
jgi:hypothetical protein